MAENVIELKIKVNSETGQLDIVGQKLSDTAKKAGQTEQSFSGLSNTTMNLIKGFATIGAAYKIIDFFKSAVKEAEEGNEAIRRLSFGLESNGISWDKNKNAVQGWASSIQESTRFSDTQALSSLEKMVRVTGNLGQAQSATTLAMNMSVVSGKDLSETLGIVTNLYNGNELALRQVRKEFASFIGDATTTDEVLKRLQISLEGAAEKENSFTKNTAILKNTLNDLKEMIGNEVIPILNTFFSQFIVPKEMDSLTKYIKALEEAGHPVEEELKSLQQEIQNTQTVIDQAHKQLGIQPVKDETLKGKQTKSELEELKKAKDEKLKIEQEESEQDWQFQQKLNIIRMQMLDERMKNENKIAKDILKTEQGTTAVKLKEMATQARAYRQSGVNEVDVAKWEAQQKFEIHKQAAMQTLATTTENLKLLAEQGKIGKDAFKTFAIAQTIISTYEGAQHAFTSLAKIPFVGPQLGFAAAAIAVAAGMARVAMIQSMHTGGEVGGSGDIPINAESGEFIVRKDIAQKNKPLLQKLNSGESSIFSEGSPINVNVTVSTNSLDLSNADFILKKLAEEIGKQTANSVKFSNAILNSTNRSSYLA